MRTRLRTTAAATGLAVLFSGLPALTAASSAQPVAPGAYAAPAAERPLPLERHYDNRAVSDEGRPDRADFDGAGNSLTSADLDAAGWRPGARLRLDAAELRRPDRAPGRPDNVLSDGQHVQLGGRGNGNGDQDGTGNGNALSFLVAATAPDRPGSAVTGTGTVHYADGGRAPYTLTAHDWRAGPLTTKALALPRINTPAGTRAESARLYAVTVPVDQGRRIASITLPKDPGPAADLHVFDVAVRSGSPGWTGSWAASTGGYTEVGPWRDRTLRLVVRTSGGGESARVRLANTFADKPLDIGRVTVAVQDEDAATRSEPRAVTFGGRQAHRVPAGAEAVSDPLRMRVPADTTLLVSMHLPGTVTAAPIHAEAIQRSYASADGAGDLTGRRDGRGYQPELTFWPFLTGIDVSGGPGSIVALGDSITDGVTSTEGANRRWPDVLSRRLLEGRGGSDVPAYGVLNHGISANRVASDRYDGDGSDPDTAGVSIQNRLERDVFAQTGARTLVVFAGINDIRWGATPEEVLTGLRAVADRARARGLRVLAATLTPCEGYHDCSPEVEAKRTRINGQLRGGRSGFDAVLDFDAVVRDPARPARMLPKYDSGDHLHPGDEGLRALAESVDLHALVPRSR
ncbi:GDSL-type esterase/lipase family protein [Streptomyces sp. XM4193]|uniref:GDSL-type esterase/lipase family protein n=1 Tax=Streptomyces sp. XM4193 TaxID=2929782 RepID=UPI001FF70244|nr:GDSL-type esterase/lipase family protein [Streptomyces sp. XM4193]MCK1797204.1 GDSL-type esterase/lipase family protein [Streptomyces sp. XM4193]